MVAWVKELRPKELEEVSGIPSGKWKRYISKGQDEVGLIFGLGMLMPGEVFSHAHKEEEVFYVLQGHGEASWQINDTTHSAELKPGVAFYKTADILHSMENTGKEPLIGIFCKA